MEDRQMLDRLYTKTGVFVAAGLIVASPLFVVVLALTV